MQTKLYFPGKNGVDWINFETFIPIFFSSDSIGQPRGAVAARLLLEMNREVRGDSVEESPEHILANKPDFFKNFSLVIATEMKEKSLSQLSQILWEANRPLMLVKVVGFVGYIRLQVKIQRQNIF